MTTEQLYKIFLDHDQKISTDSRKITPGSIFFALKGEKFDGNQFAQNAIDNGADLAVIDNPKYKIPGKTILVNDVLSTLQNLAKYHRQQFQIPFLALTGTAGKTTTKNLIAAVLSQQFTTYYTVGNLNNHIGVPLTILNIKSDAQIAVIEMGASYPDDIKLLCSIVSPTHGLITNIGTAHIEKFGSKQQLIKTKTDLYRAIINNDGTIFINSDDQLLTSLLNYNKTFSYGSNPKADTYGYLIDSQFTMNFAFRTKNNQILTVKTNLFGDYNLYNALAAVAVGQFWNIPDNLIASAIQNYSPDNYRSQILKTPNNLLILDLYNANPTSMSKALHSFKLFNAQNKTLILGDMLELGNIALEEHQKIVNLAENLGFKNTFLIGPIFSKTNTTFPKFLSTDDFARFLSDNPLKNKTILLKASRGIHLEKLIKLL